MTVFFVSPCIYIARNTAMSEHFCWTSRQLCDESTKAHISRAYGKCLKNGSGHHVKAIVDFRSGGSNNDQVWKLSNAYVL